MADGQVVFEITGDNSNIKRSLQDTTKAISDESKNWDKTVDDSSGNISDSLIGAFKAVTASAAFVKISQMLLQLAGESIQLASDLEEVQNVVDVTFGAEGSKQIEKWASEASKNFGLTELQAKRYASTIGAMMKSSGMTEGEIADMSMNLAGLAADMASFYNMPFDEAFSKIQSGMAGMSMPLRQLGIDMTETSVAAYAAAAGFETEYSKMSEAEQQIVRYQYLMKATSDAQGDFARTSDSYANSQRRLATGFDTLKAQLGEALLPIATDISNAVADLLELLTYTPPETAFDVAADSMADAVEQSTKAQGILGYMDKLYEKYGDAATKTEEWASALEQLKTVMPDVNKFINEQTGELTATNEQLREYVENSKQAAIEDAKKNAIQSLTDQYTQAGMDYYTAEINRDIANEQAKEAAYGVIDYLISGYRRQQEMYGYGDEWYGEDAFDREAYMQSLEEGNLDLDTLLTSAYELAASLDDDTTVIERYGEIYEEQRAAASSASAEMETLASNMQSLETDLSIAEAALARMSQAADSASGSLASIPGATGAGYASGLDYVPFEGLYHLHPGERVQTAAEASLTRQAGLSRPGLDYNTLGGLMRDNVKAGGDVYLDGRTVGHVISDMQGKSYRALQRSGWQQ